jgi:hypothetical protein
LVAIAAAFFVPSYRACSDEPLRSAAQFATDGWFEATWIVPVFAFAAAFAAFTALGLKNGVVARLHRKIALGLLGALALSNLGFGGAATLGDGEWPWLAAGALTTISAAALVRRARGHDPWQVWEHLLAAFLALAAGTGPTVMLAEDLVLNGGAHLGPGAWLFLGAQLLLLPLLTVSLLRARLSPAGQVVRIKAVPG